MQKKEDLIKESRFNDNPSILLFCLRKTELRANGDEMYLCY
jgi:hypothetical protein